MKTVKDLIQWCIKNGVSAIIEPDPGRETSVVRMKVRDDYADRTYCRCIDVVEIERSEGDVTDWVLGEATKMLGLDKTPMERKYRAIVDKLENELVPDAVRINGVEIPYEEYKKLKGAD